MLSNKGMLWTLFVIINHINCTNEWDLLWHFHLYWYELIIATLPTTLLSYRLLCRLQEQVCLINMLSSVFGSPSQICTYKGNVVLASLCLTYILQFHPFSSSSVYAKTLTQAPSYPATEKKAETIISQSWAPFLACEALWVEVPIFRRKTALLEGWTLSPRLSLLHLISSLM